MHACAVHESHVVTGPGEACFGAAVPKGRMGGGRESFSVATRHRYIYTPPGYRAGGTTVVLPLQCATCVKNWEVNNFQAEIFFHVKIYSESFVLSE